MALLCAKYLWKEGRKEKKKGEKGIEVEEREEFVRQRLQCCRHLNSAGQKLKEGSRVSLWVDKEDGGGRAEGS